MKSDRAGILIIFAKLEEDVVDNFEEVTDVIKEHLVKMEKSIEDSNTSVTQAIKEKIDEV